MMTSKSSCTGSSAGGSTILTVRVGLLVLNVLLVPASFLSNKRNNTVVESAKPDAHGVSRVAYLANSPRSFAGMGAGFWRYRYWGIGHQ